MIVSSDGSRAIVSDPDRDRVVVMSLDTGEAIKELYLEPGDEPGRLVEDNQGNVHVALRRGGAVVTIDGNGNQLMRRYACTEPRGIAFDANAGLVHTACAGGELVSFNAATGDAPVRSLRLERDLRDVIVRADGNLIVTKFRTAEILTVGTGGTIINRQVPPTVQRFDFGVFDAPGGNAIQAGPSIAWRTIAMPDGTIVMSHQRKTRDRLDETIPGGYGGGCGEGPVEPAVTMIAPAPGSLPQAIRRIGGKGALPVDIASSPSGDKLALVMAGSRRVTVVNASTALSQPDPEGNEGCDPPPPKCEEDEDHDNGGGGEPRPMDDIADVPTGTVPPDVGGGGDKSECDNDDDDQGEDRKRRLGAPTSVAFRPNGELVIFYPESQTLVVRAATGTSKRRLTLPGKIAYDPGRSVFHSQTQIGLACASCHPEGRDDGLVWSFATLGNRRTQSLAGELLSRAPFHWTGDEASLPILMDDVFSSRMAGGFISDNQKAALGPWLDRIPAPPPAVVDAQVAERGKQVFEAAGCVACHNGPLLTNNQLVNVGTGGKFKVPSLLGIGARAPFMHDGCAKTLMDRFVTCGGGDLHGVTSTLTETQLTELVTYLESL